VVYVGRFDYFDNFTRSDYPKAHKTRKFIFWNGKEFLFLNSLSSVSVLYSDTVVSDYAELVDKYYKSINGSSVKRLFKGEKQKKYYLEDVSGSFALFIQDNWGQTYKCSFALSEGRVLMTDIRDNYCGYKKNLAIDESKYLHNLYAELESGSVYLINYAGWLKEFILQGEQNEHT
jgi:hypothetical protein